MKHYISRLTEIFRSINGKSLSAMWQLITLPDVPKRRVSFSVITVMEKIEKIYPDLQLVSIGESDFIVDYIRQKKKSRVWQGLMVAFVSVFTFVGSAYAIMAYNNDVSTNEIFEKEYKVIEIAYAVGLLLGIVVFYNHFAGKHFTGDPTPIQVEMDKYETDIDNCMIDRSSTEGKEK